MKVLIIFATVIAVCSAGILHSPAAYVQSYAVPSVLTRTRVAIPASIPATIPEVITSAHTVPEHRFSSSEWIQPTSHVIPAVRQYTVRTDTPVAVRHLSVEPAVQYTSALAPVAFAAPAIAPIGISSIGPIVQQNIW